MKLRTRIGRRWRSVSFRSGLLSALSVGIVASLAFFMLTVLVFILFAVTEAVAETSLVDRAEDQLLLGVAPADLDLESTLDTFDGPRDEGSGAFWVVLSDGEILNSEGVVDQQVLQADFSDSDFTVEIGAPQRPEDLLGIKAVGDREWFYFERQVIVPDGSTYQVVTAYDGTFSLWRFARSSFPVTIPLLLVLMAVAMAVTSWLTRRALRRVEHMRAEVELITQQSLDRRVPTVNASDGIEKLAHTMNDMLGRLESSNAQQNQFLADASHELRSPVAGLLAQLDVATMYPDKVDSTVLLPKLRDEAQRLQLLVDDLLFLSRSEANSDSASDDFSAVDVDGLIAGEAAHQANIDQSVNIVVGDAAATQVPGNARDLARALRNLVDNAVRHCENEVRIDAEVTDTEVVIRVADDGPGIATEDEERIFKRFVRLDEARTRDIGGSGLGLAIASEIAASHNGSIRLGKSVIGGATFELALPRGIPAGSP
ncbi:MAG: sensor histidine kinase [Acidimicrobiales bacterium]